MAPRTPRRAIMEPIMRAIADVIGAKLKAL
jgi:hypothetical protein